MKKKIYILKKSIIKFIFIFIILILLIILNLINSYKCEHILIDEIYLAIGEEYKLYEKEIFKSLDNNIVSIKDNKIVGIKKGSTKVINRKLNKIYEIKVYVSDLFTVDILNNDKGYLSCNQYSEEENIYLDKVLEYKINNVGYKTRAAVVEAARFLTLEFKYRIHYFYENGRLLTNGTRSYVDGEGRYYHKGLYLNDSKKEDIVASQYGPSIWGCDLYTKILKETTPNGLDCSGFISWTLLNAGFDVGDRGAGISKNKTNDLDDLGKKVKINKESINQAKVGDLLSRDGHIGILIGIDNNNFYVAEALDYDLHVLTYTKKELIKSDWTYFINLDELYLNDGNLTNMW